jgi:hypothetical protein
LNIEAHLVYLFTDQMLDVFARDGEDVHVLRHRAEAHETLGEESSCHPLRWSLDDGCPCGRVRSSEREIGDVYVAHRAARRRVDEALMALSADFAD